MYLYNCEFHPAWLLRYKNAPLILTYFTCRYKLGSSDIKVLSSDDEERTQELEEQAAPMEDTSEGPDLQSQIHGMKEEIGKVRFYNYWIIIGL